jgi:hypothetical protein
MFGKGRFEVSAKGDGMHRGLIFAALLASLAAPAASEGPAQFTDTACPDATPIGRHLNTLSESTPVPTPELMSTALQLVSVYQACAEAYDRGTALGGGSQDANANGVVVLRLYAHLALARAEQRVGNYYASQHKYGDARASYDAALKFLGTLKALDTGDVPAGSTARLLLNKGSEIKKEIETAEAALPKSAPAPEEPVPGTVEGFPKKG